MEHLIKKIADISKEKDCHVWLGIRPDGSLIIYVYARSNDYRIISADWSEESILNVIKDAIRLAGEIHSIYQKMYQGHAFEVDHVKKEFGDLLWFIAEYCTAKGWSLDDIMRMNIDKLKERYPDGFKAEQSLHRKAGDI